MSETRTKAHQWARAVRAALQMALKSLEERKCEIVLYRLL